MLQPIKSHIISLASEPRQQNSRWKVRRSHRSLDQRRFALRQECRILFIFFALLLVPVVTSRGAIINLTTNDSYTKLESARAGDEVIVAPGTYRFRVYFSATGSPAKPIIVRAQDPSNRPVWDLSATVVENAPGS